MSELSPLAVAVPFGIAALLVASLPLRRRADDLVATVTAGALIVFCALLLVDALGPEGPLVAELGNWQPRPDGAVVGIVLGVEPGGAALATLSALLVTVALVFAWRYFDTSGPRFHALMLVFLGALIGFVLSGDLFNMFVFFELMSVSAYAMTAYRIERPPSLQGAIGFAVVNSIGAMLILFGIALLYARTGALNLAQVGEALAARDADGLVVVAFALLVGGFMVKAAVVPFHFWLADAYAVAPTPAAIVFTGVMSDIGLFAIARIYWTAFEGPMAPHADGIRAVLIGFAVLTALVGAIMCLAQTHVKRLLAFVTISQIGVALAGIALLTPLGAAGASLIIPADGLLRAGLFVCIGILVHKCGSLQEDALRGEGRRVPRLVGVLFVAAAVGLAAMPPFGAFAGKSLIEEAAADVGYGWIAVPILVATVLTSAALLRAAGRIFLGLGPGKRGHPDAEDSEIVGARGYVPAVMLASATILVVAGLVVGVVPGVLDLSQDTAARLTDRGLYAAAVLERPLPPDPAGATHGIGIVEVFLGILTTVGSLALAAALLGAGGLKRPIWDPAPRVGRGALLRLRRLHSGQIGDYVAWLVLGFAALSGALLAVA
jgi:multicomponent Na+:H+ antiporter subunit D